MGKDGDFICWDTSYCMKAPVAIETGNTIAGDFPRKQIRLVQAWVELHRDELMLNYLESQNEGKLKKIKPLD